MQAKRLLLLTDVEGVLDKDKRLVHELSIEEARALIQSGTISGGMIPKIEGCIEVVEAGVEAVVIIDGRVPHCVLLELFTDAWRRHARTQRAAEGASQPQMTASGKRLVLHSADPPDPGPAPAAKRDFADTTAWIFDLDNTLYPARCNLFAEVDKRMGKFIADYLGVPFEQARHLQKSYYRQFGTTLSGLMQVHKLDPQPFLDYVHDIDLSVVPELPELAAAIGGAAGTPAHLHQRLAPPR